MVEIFKTNVNKLEESETILQKLFMHFPGSKINFDLEDCDRILRVECIEVMSEKIMEVLKEEGYGCEILD